MNTLSVPQYSYCYMCICYYQPLANSQIIFPYLDNHEPTYTLGQPRPSLYQLPNYIQAAVLDRILDSHIDRAARNRCMTMRARSVNSFWINFLSITSISYRTHSQRGLLTLASTFSRRLLLRGGSPSISSPSVYTSITCADLVLIFGGCCGAFLTGYSIASILAAAISLGVAMERKSIVEVMAWMWRAPMRIE